MDWTIPWPDWAIRPRGHDPKARNGPVLADPELDWTIRQSDPGLAMFLNHGLIWLLLATVFFNNNSNTSLLYFKRAGSKSWKVLKLVMRCFINHY